MMSIAVLTMTFLPASFIAVSYLVKFRKGTLSNRLAVYLGVKLSVGYRVNPSNHLKGVSLL
jgi:hypothetical protein